MLKVAAKGSNGRLFQADGTAPKRDGFYSVAFDARELIVKGNL